MSFWENSAPTDGKMWRIYPSGGSLYIAATNDADTVNYSSISMNRSGDVYTTNAVHVETGNNPSLYLMDRAQAVNYRVFRIMAQSQLLRFYKQDDIESGHLVLMELDRAGSLTVTGNLNAYGTAGNVAQKHVTNTFATHQNINGYLYVNTAPAAGDASIFLINAGRTYRILNFQDSLQTWCEGTLVLTLASNGNFTLNQATSGVGRLIFGTSVALRAEGANNLGVVSADNTAYAQLQCGNIYTASAANNLGDLTVRGGTNFQGGVTVTAGGATITGVFIVYGSADISSSLVLGGNFHNRAGTFIYPGRNDITPDGTIQGNWYLGSNGAYGLYTNTGLFIAGALTCNGGVNVTGITCTTVSASGVLTGSGFGCRYGTPGPAVGNQFNFHWDGNVGVWIDASNMGAMMISSDARIKRNFTPVGGYLDKILRLNPGLFYFRKVTDREPSPDSHFGLLAQEVQSIIPELVHNTGMITELTPDGLLRLDYMEMIPLLVKAIQELAKKVGM
jgi:hypothetical protein